jgi:glycerol-3-phosphate dehydrogenase
MLSVEETLRREPLLKAEGLKGSGTYVEYRTDDARLTMEVMKSAVQHGAQAVNYAEVVGFLYEEGQVVGVTVKERLSGHSYKLYAKRVVNAAGPWVDRLRALNGVEGSKGLHLTKGVHIVFDHTRFPLQQAVYFDVPDGRMLFAIPRQGKTYLGTTDTFYEEDPADPRMTAKDRDYLLTSANAMFPSLGLTAEDVESSWAGLRPLIAEAGKSPSAISRRDEIWQDATGLISIAGGKLTGYRKMAQSIVDRVSSQLEQKGEGPFGPCKTKTLAISGGEVGGAGDLEPYIQSMADEGLSFGFRPEAARSLARTYGSNTPRVFRYAATGRRPLAGASLPMEIYASLLYSIEEEMAVKPVDFWIRRNGSLLFDRKTVERWKRPALDLMRQVYGWDDVTVESYTKELEQELSHAISPVEE